MPSNNTTEMIARLHVQGKSLAEIARRMGRDEGFVKAILKQNDAKAFIAKFKREGLSGSAQRADEMLHDDDKRATMARLKAKALHVLEDIMDRPRDSMEAIKNATRAALWVLERDAVIQEEVKAAQAGGTLEGQPLMQPIYMDKRAINALERIAREFEGEDWIEKFEQQLNEMPPGAE